MKRIAFLITDNGIDGRDIETINEAFWSEEQRDAAWEAKGDNKNYHSKVDRIRR